MFRGVSVVREIGWEPGSGGGRGGFGCVEGHVEWRGGLGVVAGGCEGVGQGAGRGEEVAGHGEAVRWPSARPAGVYGVNACGVVAGASRFSRGEDRSVYAVNTPLAFCRGRPMPPTRPKPFASSRSLCLMTI
ncbi:hypothetical protein GCM10018955_75270 [Planomonospora venezuelensis]